MKLIELKGITKTFGDVVANDNINLDICGSEVHAILGENGAGKSSLMNIISGIYQPDFGEIKIKGESKRLLSPAHSIKEGIGMIHQHLKLVEAHNAKENIIAGQNKSFFINKNKLADEIRSISQKYGLEIDPKKRVSDMSIAEKQRVEILKVLYRGAKVLILDEPTAVLTPQETKKLFEIINRMKDDGCAIVIITHKLNEVMEISDKVSILRKGRYIKTLETKNSNERELTDLMVGKSSDLTIERPNCKGEREVLSIKDLTVLNGSGGFAIDGLNLSIMEGQVIGVAGIAGSGQKELCESIAGLQKIKSGNIVFKDENLVGKTPREIIKKGISMSFVPEDRLGMGLISNMDMVENIMLKKYQTGKGIFIDKKPVVKLAKKLVEKLSISTPSIETPVRMLSGGNIQKVLLGREIENEPELIITAYPTRGLDIGSSHKIYDLLNDQKKKKTSILFVGEDLDVLMNFCDNIAVMCDGKLTGIVKASETTREELGLMMAGKTLEEVRKIV